MDRIATLFARAAVVAAMAMTASCATVSSTYGQDFPTTNISQIVKGKTTAAELMQWFGQPFQKTIISDTRENWIYTYSVSESHATSFVFVTNIKSTGSQKILSLVLDSGIVTTFIFNDNNGPQAAGETIVR